MDRALLAGIVFTAGLLLAAPAAAEEASFANHANLALELEQQNARISELEAALDQRGHLSGACGEGCCEPDCGCDPCCRPAGVIGGAELTFLKPHGSDGVRGTNTDIDFGYATSPRAWLGYQGSDGLGYRVRYWEFDHRETVPSVTAGQTDSVSYDTYILDAEMFDSMNLGCYWDATLFAGFRYVEFDQERVRFGTTSGTIVTGYQFENSSIGLSLGGELRRCMGHGVAGYAGMRGSVLMGDEVQTQIGTNQIWTLFDRELDNVYYIWEAQSGVQWTQDTGCGYLFARAGFEVQIWDNFAGGNEDFGLGGFAFSAGVIR